LTFYVGILSYAILKVWVKILEYPS